MTKKKTTVEYDWSKYNAQPKYMTPEKLDILSRELARGHSISSACARADINPQTFHNWYRKGGELESALKYQIFRDEVDKAKGLAIELAENKIIDDIYADNVNTAKWWLERRAKNDYSPKQVSEVKNDVNITADKDLLEKLRAPLPELEEEDK